MRTAIVLTALLAAGSVPVAAQQQADPEGERVFRTVCSMCHTITPPPRIAPPMSHAAAYYRVRHADTDVAAAAIVAYVKRPAADRSLLPAQVIQRFGLMPPQPGLSDERLHAVARYVLTLADTTHVQRGN